MVLMVFDHVREFFYYPMQVSDPMSLDITSTELFFTRIITHLCAPVFVFLAGVSAFLYAQNRHITQSFLTLYLFKRGILLILLEISVVNFGWIFGWEIIYLQVIWAIGCSMIALSLLLWLPWQLQILLSVLLIGGHNFLDSIHFHESSPWYLIWAVLHDRTIIELFGLIKIRTSYPILPWIGVILLGYQFGKVMVPSFDPKKRKNIILSLGVVALITFIIIRIINFGDSSIWIHTDDLLVAVKSFLNVTKYPPSLAFLLLTLGIGMLLLYFFESFRSSAFQFFEILGKNPLVFYLLHIYVLHFVYLFFVETFGYTHDKHYAFSSVYAIWFLGIIVNIIFYYLIKFYTLSKTIK